MGLPRQSGAWDSHFHCRCVGSVPSQGTRILHEVWPGQKKNKSERGDNDGDETILWWWLVVMVANKKPCLVVVVRSQKLSRPPTNGNRGKKIQS